MQEKFDPLGPRAGFQRSHQAGSASAAGTPQPGALGPERMVFARRRVARAVRASIIGWYLFELDAIGHEKFVRGGAMLSEGPHDGAVIVAVIRPAVGLHDGPVGQIGKDEVRRIDNAVFALRARTTAKRDVAAAQYRMPADIVVRFDHEHGRPPINGRNGGRQPRGASANDHHIRRQVPACRQVASARLPYIRTTDVDRAALETVRKLGMTPVEVSLPDWPYDSLQLILFAEGAAAFEELTLKGGLRELKAQVPDAWPNLFRQSRFLSAVDFVQTDRFRRKVAKEMARIFSEVDLLLVPSLRDEMLTITNFTGQPSLTLRAGFVNVSEARSDWAPDPKNPLPKFDPPRRVPHGVTLIGRLFEEGTLCTAGIALERAFAVAGERPVGF